VRVANDPMLLSPATDEVGPNRFDDPRVNTQNRFVVRYTATSLRGCLSEILAWTRPNKAAIELEAAVDSDEPEMLAVPGAALATYLAGKHVAVIKTTRRTRVPSIDDSAVQARLDGEPAVRALLDSPDAHTALLPAGAHASPHLDNAAVRLSTGLGRELTQHCSLALWDRGEHGVHYRSRHDDAEDCWELYDRVGVVELSRVALSPTDPDHPVLGDIASMWDLDIPPAWVL